MLHDEHHTISLTFRNISGETGHHMQPNGHSVRQREGEACIRRGRAARRTCSVDDAVCPAGVAKSLKLLHNVLYDWCLPIDAVQQPLHLHRASVAIEVPLSEQNFIRKLPLLGMLSTTLESSTQRHLAEQ